MNSKHWRADRQRRSQIRRYYAEGEAPQNIINLAMEHMKNGYNKI